MKNQYHKTIYACFLGYIVQAIVNNFVPLLFLTFEETYHRQPDKVFQTMWSGFVKTWEIKIVIIILIGM